MKSHRYKKILEYVNKEGAVTTSEIARILKVSWNTAESYLKDLVIENKIKRKKEGGVNIWIKK